MLNLLVRHLEEHGFQPTYRELAEHMGCSIFRIHTMMKSLQRRGLVALPGDNRERAVRLLHVRVFTVPRG